MTIKKSEGNIDLLYQNNFQKRITIIILFIITLFFLSPFYLSGGEPIKQSYFNTTVSYFDDKFIIKSGVFDDKKNMLELTYFLSQKNIGGNIDLSITDKNGTNIHFENIKSFSENEASYIEIPVKDKNFYFYQVNIKFTRMSDSSSTSFNQQQFSDTGIEKNNVNTNSNTSTSKVQIDYRNVDNGNIITKNKKYKDNIIKLKQKKLNYLREQLKIKGSNKDQIKDQINDQIIQLNSLKNN